MNPQADLQLAPPTAPPVVAYSAPAGDASARMAAFEGWAANRTSTSGSKLSSASKAHYRLIWRSWLRFLAEQQPPVPWDEAGQAQVDAFLKSADPSAKRRRDISDVTERRYWTLLDDVYRHALHLELVRTNPASPLRTAVAPTEHVASCRLQPLHLERLREALTSHKFSEDDEPGTSAWKPLRDRAMLALLLDIGPTSAEIQHLRPSMISSASSGLIIRLDGQRAAQRRDLRLSRTASAAVRVWMRHHLTLDPRPDHVFFSRKGRGPMSKVGIFGIVRSFLATHLPAMGLDNTQHQGPALIRNCVIHAWMEQGVPDDEIVKRAGLANIQCLRRLVTSTTPHPQ